MTSSDRTGQNEINLDLIREHSIFWCAGPPFLNDPESTRNSLKFSLKSDSHVAQSPESRETVQLPRNIPSAENYESARATGRFIILQTPLHVGWHTRDWHTRSAGAHHICIARFGGSPRLMRGIVPFACKRGDERSARRRASVRTREAARELLLLLLRFFFFFSEGGALWICHFRQDYKQLACYLVCVLRVVCWRVMLLPVMIFSSAMLDEFCSEMIWYAFYHRCFALQLILWFRVERF